MSDFPLMPSDRAMIERLAGKNARLEAELAAERERAERAEARANDRERRMGWYVDRIARLEEALRDLEDDARYQEFLKGHHAAVRAALADTEKKEQE